MLKKSMSQEQSIHDRLYAEVKISQIFKMNNYQDIRVAIQLHILIFSTIHMLYNN